MFGYACPRATSLSRDRHGYVVRCGSAGFSAGVSRETWASRRRWTGPVPCCATGRGGTGDRNAIAVERVGDRRRVGEDARVAAWAASDDSEVWWPWLRRTVWVSRPPGRRCVRWSDGATRRTKGPGAVSRYRGVGRVNAPASLSVRCQRLPSRGDVGGACVPVDDTSAG